MSSFFAMDDLDNSASGGGTQDASCSTFQSMVEHRRYTQCANGLALGSQITRYLSNIPLLAPVRSSGLVQTDLYATSMRKSGKATSLTAARCGA